MRSPRGAGPWKQESQGGPATRDQAPGSQTAHGGREPTVFSRKFRYTEIQTVRKEKQMGRGRGRK